MKRFSRELAATAAGFYLRLSKSKGEIEVSRELLFSLSRKDFRIDTFRSGGKGGQHQNKTESGVRITHIESGAVGESREERSQHQNKRVAFDRLIESLKFKSWHRRKCASIMLEKQSAESIERQVDRDMNPDNLRVEAQIGGKWTELTDAAEVDAQ